MKNYSFAEHLSNFFNNYLVIQKNYSEHTIRSYKITFKLFVKYLIDNKKVSLKKISLNDLTRNNVIDFLNYLETSDNILISTRNNRLAAIKSFCNYLNFQDLTELHNIQQILLIPSKKGDNRLIEYLTKEELTIYLNSIKTNNRKGIRDYTLVSLLYDSAIRESELTNLKVNDLNLGNNPSVTVFGKGRKYRQVPITNDTKNLLIKFIQLEKLNNFDYLFKGNNDSKCSTKMISHIVAKYAKLSGINKNIHPHVFRHTRAMHMLEAGIPLVYIRDILGHENVTTTEIYAKVNVETKRNALENVYKNNNSFEYKDASWNKNSELLKSLLELD